MRVYQEGWQGAKWVKADHKNGRNQVRGECWNRDTMYTRGSLQIFLQGESAHIKFTDTKEGASATEKRVPQENEISQLPPRKLHEDAER